MGGFEQEALIFVICGHTPQVEDLQRKADEGARLKDQVDEYKHAADKLQRTENVIEKYKKKLEEGADVRRQVKVSTLAQDMSDEWP